MAGRRRRADCDRSGIETFRHERVDQRELGGVPIDGCADGRWDSCAAAGGCMIVATTERLILRRWRPADRDPFARLNVDPRVMEFFPSVLSRAQSDALVLQIEANFDLRGFGLCAVELRADGSFLGFVGLDVPRFEAAFTPCVEIGWRLSAQHWGQGLATAGARALVTHAYASLQAGGAGCFHRASECAVAARDGEDRDDARPGRGF